MTELLKGHFWLLKAPIKPNPDPSTLSEKIEKHLHNSHCTEQAPHGSAFVPG